MTAPNTEQTPTDTEQEQPPAPEAPKAPEVNLDEVRNIYNAALREASQRAERAEQETQRMRDERNQEPPATPEQDRQNFFDNPRQMLREEMKQIIAPLNEFQQRFSKQETYNNFLAKYSNMQAFRFLRNPLVLQQLANAAGQMPQLTEDALGGAYNMIVGHLYNTGQLQDTPQTPPAPENTPQPQNNPPVQPPNTPRSAPLPPINNNAPKAPVLNEHEKQLARYNNMSEQEYYDFLHMDKSDVARSPEVKK